MNLKTKAFALVSAGLLSIGIMGAAALAAGNDASTTVTLTGDSNACSAAASESTLDFGEYTFNASTGHYVAPGTLPNIVVDVNAANPPGTCDVTMIGTDLTAAINATTYTINSSDITIGAATLGDGLDGTAGQGFTLDTASGLVVSGSAAPGTATMSVSIDVTGLNGLPPSSATDAGYSGTVTVTGGPSL